MLKKCILIILCSINCICIFSCSLFDGDKQPLVSQNRESLQQFNEATTFPFQATSERRESILLNSPKIQVGMSGDEVLNIMGKPDEISTNAFVGGPVKGWFWDYNIYKKYERAPDDSDINVHIYFDIEGKVKDIWRHNIK